MLNEGACNFRNIHLSWITTSWRKLAFDISGKSAPPGARDLACVVLASPRKPRLPPDSICWVRRRVSPGPKVAIAQIAAFRAWEHFNGERFAKLRKMTQPCLVVNGAFDNMIPVRNSYMLSEHLIERDAVDLPRRWAWFTFSIS
jgi:hypothetical protein